MTKTIYTILIITLFTSIFSESKAQYTEIDKNAYDYNDIRLFGKNRQSYLQFYLGLGFITPVGENTGSEINFGRSTEAEIGLRYKRRLNNWLALGASFSLDFMNYNIKQEEGKTFPDTVLYDKQKFSSDGFSITPFLRINFGKRGNEIGTYLDLGYYFNWLENQQVEEGNVEPYSLVMTKNPDYASNQSQGVFVALGAQMWSIYAKYRLTRLIEDEQFADLTPLIIGLQVGF